MTSRRSNGVTECGDTAGDDRDLGDTIGARPQLGDERMSGFVMCHDALLRRVDHFGFAFEAGDDPVNGIFEVAQLDGVLARARRPERRLVDQVGEIGPDEARRPSRDEAQIETRGQRDVPRVYTQDLLAAVEVGSVDHDLPIESSGAEQRGIQDLGTVRRRHEDHALLRVEAVHLREQLIQRLLALVMPTHDGSHSTGLAKRIELVDEDDAGRVSLGLRKQIADASRADTHEHLDEIRPAQTEERDLGFAGHRLRQERLAGSRLPDQ
jgi:hypothetical protein